ncbi:MAG: hypothetical protein H6636_05645 [Anaerolineales bacterium]|nr:hypothetical protein [Anaerolineales bacterium]
MVELDFARWAVPAVGVLLVTGLVVLASQDWRWIIAALGVQYAAVFVLVAGSWRLELAVVKLVAGWMATAILGASQDMTQIDPERAHPSGSVFRVLVGAMVGLTVFSLVPDVMALLAPYMDSVPWPELAGGLLLMGMGLALLGLNARPLRVILALLVLFSGFEVLYAVVEDSTLVAGLLALVNLALAMMGAYLHLVARLELPEEKRP